MQLNLKTDYAIRTLLYLATKNATASSTEISEQMVIPKSMISEFAVPLQRAGILTTQRGAGGGFALGRTPADISLHEVINLLEGTTRINRCLEDNHKCSRNATATCPVRKFYVRVQTYLEEAFRDKTIASLLED
ncbi:MAG: Rrf2 family transcriptional regulator [Clostridiaceae bacterium]|nr:Rrf2 family transcriptional regulator [Clostridiaceae bacterium]